MNFLEYATNVGKRYRANAQGNLGPVACRTPGMRIRSRGMGRGLGRGRGMGPVGAPYGRKFRG